MNEKFTKEQNDKQAREITGNSPAAARLGARARTLAHALPGACLSLLLILLFAGNAWGQQKITYTPSGNGTNTNKWTVQATVTKVKVHGVGAGGGGGKATATSTTDAFAIAAGGGGGGGAYDYNTVEDVEAGKIFTFFVAPETAAGADGAASWAKYGSGVESDPDVMKAIGGGKGNPATAINNTVHGSGGSGGTYTNAGTNGSGGSNGGDHVDSQLGADKHCADGGKGGNSGSGASGSNGTTGGVTGGGTSCDTGNGSGVGTGSTFGGGGGGGAATTYRGRWYSVNPFDWGWHWSCDPPTTSRDGGKGAAGTAYIEFITITSAQCTQTTCPNENTGKISVQVNAGNTTTGFNYVVKNSAGTTVKTVNNQSNNYIITDLPAGELTVYVTLGDLECKKSVTVGTTGSPAVTLNDFNTNPVFICPGGSAELTAPVASSTGTLTYAWSPATGLTPNATSETVNASPNSEQTYTVTVTATHNGCTASSNKSVTVKVNNPSVSLNDIAFNPASPVCAGSNVTMSVSPSASNGTVTYKWSGPGFSSQVEGQSQTLNNVTSDDAGIYKVTATATLGTCTVTATKEKALAVNSPAVTLNDITFDPASPVCVGTPVTMSVSPSASNGTVTYSWEGPGFSSTVSGPSQTLNNVTTSQAGTYKVTATATVGSCTKTDYKEKVLTVNVAPTLEDVPTQTITYGHSMDAVTLVSTNATSVLPVSTLPSWMAYNETTHTLTGTTPPPAVGTYTVTFRATGGAGCDPVDKTVTVIVNKATLTVTTDNKTKVYGDPDPTPLTATVTGMVNGDTENDLRALLHLQITRTEGEDVGQYTISATGDELANYNVTYNNTGKLTITKATVTVTADDKSKIYAHSDPVLTATLSGLKNDDPTSVISYSLSRVAGENVGDYTITSAGDDVQGNYNVVYETGTLTITPLSVTVNITGNTSMQAYTGGTLSVTGFTAVSDNSLYDVASVSCTTATASGVQEGTYQMGLTVDHFTNTDENFDVAFNIVSDGWLQIVPAGTVIVTIEGHTSVLDYDANAHSVSGYDVSIWTPDGSPAYTEADFTFNGNATATGTNVNTYPMGLTASQFTNTNSAFTNVMFNVTDGYLTINKANVEVIVTGNTAIREYDNNEKTVEGYTMYTNSSLYNMSNVGFTGSATASRTVVGITHMDLAFDQFTNSDNNFNVTFNVEDGWLEIVAAGTVIVNIIGNNDTYTYNGTEQTVTDYTIGNIEGHHTETGQAYSEYYPQTAIHFLGTTADKTAARTIVGTTFMNLTEDMFENTDEHFIVRFHVTNGYVKVTPAPVTVTIVGDNQSDVYDGTAHTVTGYNVTSIKINDEETTLYTTNDFTFSGVASATRTVVGTTNMNLASNQFANTNPNFSPVTFNVTDGFQTITSATMAITITGNTYTTTYDAQPHTVSGYTATPTSESSLFNPAKVVRTGGTPTLTETNAGTYYMELAPSQFTYNDPNFENVTFTVVSDGKLTINKATLTVTIEGHTDTKPYNGGVQNVTGYDIIIPSDATLTETEINGPEQTAAIAQGTSVGGGTNADGSYPMGLTQGQFSTTNTNYDVSFSVTDGWLKITPIDVMVTIVGANSTIIYDGQEHSVNGYTIEASTDLYNVNTDVTKPEQDASVATATRTSVGTTVMALSATNFVNTNPNFNNVVFNVTPGYQTIAPANVLVCSGSDTYEVNFGTTEGVSYEWSAPDGGDIGMSVTSGIGSIPSFTATNTSNAVKVATVTITPKFTRGEVVYTCDEVSYTITVPTTLTADKEVTNLTCNYWNNFTNDGKVVITVSGGTPTYEYKLGTDDVYQTSNTFSDLATGNYVVNVKDANGCTVDVPFVIAEPDYLEITDIAISEESCSPGNDGAATVIYSGGNPGQYHFLWSNGQETETATVTGLRSQRTDNSVTPPVEYTGYYVVTVTDAKGCSAVRNFTMTLNNTLVMENITGPTICLGGDFLIKPSDSANCTLPAGTKYSWSAPTASACIDHSDLTQKSNQPNISGVLTGNCQYPVTVTYSVTPSYGVCQGNHNGEAAIVTVQVNPGVTMTLNPNEPIVKNRTDENFNLDVAFASSFSDYTVVWTREEVLTGDVTTVATHNHTHGTSDTCRYTVNPAALHGEYIYTATYTGAEGCSKTGTFNVTVQDNLIVTANSHEWTYDGADHIDPGFVVTTSATDPDGITGTSGTALTLPNGDKLTTTITGTAHNVGTVDNVVGTVTIMRGEENVTGYYNIVKNDGVLTIKPTVELVSTPESPICSGNTYTATFDATISGDNGTITYAWSRDNTTNVTGDNADDGNISVALTNTQTTAQTVVFTVTPTFTPTGGGAQIVGPEKEISMVVWPALVVSDITGGGTYCLGATVTLTETPQYGSGSYNIVWKNGENTLQTDNGVTTSNYTPSTATSGSNTTYTVQVADAACPEQGDTKEVTVKVYEALALADIADRTICVGTSTTLTASASNGTEPYEYKWYKNGDLISGATSASYATPTTDAVSGQSVTYKVVVTDACENTIAVNDEAVVSVYNTLSASSTSSDAEYCKDAVADALTISVIGSGDYSYQWMGNGNAITGATAASYTPSTATYGSDTTFTVTVKDEICNTETTITVAEINVYDEFTLTAGSDATYCHNSSPVTELEAVATGGAGGYSYQWQTYNGTTWVDVPSNGTNATYTPSVATVGTFRYHAVVTDGQCGTLTSNEVTITVNPLPTITATPATQTITYGDNIANIVLATTNATVVEPIALPSGLSYNSSTMTISGIPTAANTYIFTVTATSNTTPSCGTTEQEITIVVNKRDLTIKLDTMKVYDGTVFVSTLVNAGNGQNNGYQISGLQNGAKASGVVTSAAKDVAIYTGNGTTGTSTITTPFTTTDGISNYNVTYNFKQEITKATLTITLDTTKVYDGAVFVSTLSNAGNGQNNGYQISGLQNGAKASGVVTSAAKDVAVYTGNGTTGTSTITTPFTTTDGISNYNVSYNFTQEITKKNLTISLDSSKVYDGTPLVVTCAQLHYNGLVSGDVFTTGTITTDGFQVGDYYCNDNNFTRMWADLTATQNGFGPENVRKNYSPTFQVVLRITARPLTLTAASDTKVYDGTPLTNNTFAVNTTLGDGDAVSATVNGSQTCLGENTNVIDATTVQVMHDNGDGSFTDVTSSYSPVTLTDGLLKVTPVTSGFSCPAAITITLTEGKIDTLVPQSLLGNPSHALITAGHAHAVNNLDAFNPMSEGVYTITWKLLDDCDSAMLTCTQNVTVEYAPCDGIVTIGGNDYTIKRIGSQCWFTENLKEPVGEHHAYNDVASNVNKFGYLYTWYTAVGVPEGTTTATPTFHTADNGTQYVQGICPAGWAVGSTDDFHTLEMYAGSMSQLKDWSTEYWQSGYEGDNPGTGFNARGGGWYNSALHRYEDIKTGYHFWKADAPGIEAFTSTSTVISCLISYYCDTILEETSNKTDMRSVRCIRKNVHP